MYFKHIYDKGLAQSSYLVGCQASGEAIVIDPRRDVEEYLKIAEQENLNITHITETHIHADFLSGSRELANITGAMLLLSDEGGIDWQYQFQHTGLKDGNKFKVGNLLFEVIHTPGHTPEHISFLLTDTASSDKPVMIFTGDFVFVGDVGRPDLLEEAAGIAGSRKTGAHQMFDSLKKFKSLPDYLQVLPGHGAGSACGKSLGAVPSSTVGYEKLVNWALNISDENGFIDTLLEGQPEAPKYFGMMKKLNKSGPQILGGIPRPGRLTLVQLKDAIEKGIKIIDTRNKLAFAGGHLPGSINIQDNGGFSTWSGWILNYEEPFILIADEKNIEDLTKSLIRIGLDNIYGYINDIDLWANQGHELQTVKQISCCEVKMKLDADYNSIQLVDVRAKSEYDEGRIEGSMNIHAGRLLDNLDLLDKNKDIILHCASGDRSSMGVSLLKSAGYENVYNLTGGFNAWQIEYPHCTDDVTMESVSEFL
ncbi:MAG: MBL fold metallo-hydrolase [Melioribacteraceae bacterium]|nr:MBL fold metallo-hydrolase [Melioribacteraceae bacterium]